MNFLKYFSYFLICSAVFFSCNQRCPESRETLDVTPQAPLLYLGQAQVQADLELQFPTDCDMAPYRGTLNLEILQPDAVPGGQLYFLENGVKSRGWTNNGITPSSGLARVPIYFAADTVNGVPMVPASGSYNIRLRATFDEPEEQDEVFVQVEVLDEGLNMFILSPQPGQIFPEGTDSVRIEAVVTDASFGINTVAFRLDRGTELFLNQGSWNYQTHQNPSEVRLDRTLLADSLSHFRLLILARNANGEEIRDSLDFVIQRDRNTGPAPLTHIFWDGGGDGRHWHDPANWEGDIVPDERHKAIIRLADALDTVVITSPGVLQEVYRVGAVDLVTNVRIERGAILQLENSSDLSEIGRSLTFWQGQDTDEWAAIRFNGQSDDTVIMQVNTLYLAGMRLEAAGRGGKLWSTVGVVNHLQHDESPLAILEGPVKYNPHSNVTMESSFTFEFKGRAEVRNEATWRTYGGINLRQDSLIEAQSVFRNLSYLYIHGSKSGDNDAELVISGPLNFISEGGITQVKNRWGNRPARTLLYSRTSSNTLGSFDTDGDVFIFYGIWQAFNINPTNIKNLYVGSQSHIFGAAPQVRLAGNSSGLEQVFVRRGDFSIADFSENGRFMRIKKIEVGQAGSFEFQSFSNREDSIAVDTLILNSCPFGLQKGDRLRVKHLDWYRASPSYRPGIGDMGTIIFEANALGTPSNLYLINSTTRPAFKFNVIIENYASLNWSHGNIVTQDTTIRPVVTIMPLGRFNIISTEAQRWGNPRSTAYSGNWVSFINYGEIRKQGASAASIYGCLFNRGTGNLYVDQGFIQFNENTPCF
ncbi:MAG: hypothetical protein MRZ79_23365 [Bacteroidia bacterium]|nr:hypothetical protein [Bacteroidia bacterium]